MEPQSLSDCARIECCDSISAAAAIQDGLSVVQLKSRNLSTKDIILASPSLSAHGVLKEPQARSKLAQLSCGACKYMSTTIH